MRGVIPVTLLGLALMGSALFLVNTTYESRRLYAAVEREKSQSRQLEMEHKRLEAERQAQSTHQRVEKVARERLQMRPAGPGLTHAVNDGGAGGGESAAAAAKGGRP